MARGSVSDAIRINNCADEQLSQSQLLQRFLHLVRKPVHRFCVITESALSRHLVGYCAYEFVYEVQLLSSVGSIQHDVFTFSLAARIETWCARQSV